MKTAALILSLYIFALNIVQCADLEEADHETQIQRFSTENHDHQNSETPIDDCSPFCSCMCCQLQVYMYKPFPVYAESIEFDSSKDYTFYAKNYLSQYLETPFHPPKSIA